jgi:hypothetical protein
MTNYVLGNVGIKQLLKARPYVYSNRFKNAFNFCARAQPTLQTHNLQLPRK